MSKRPRQSSSPGAVVREPLNVLDAAFTDRATPVIFRFRPVKNDVDQFVKLATEALEVAITTTIPQFGGWLERDVDLQRWCLAYDVTQPPLHATKHVVWDGEDLDGDDWSFKLTDEGSVVTRAMNELNLALFKPEEYDTKQFPFSTESVYRAAAFPLLAVVFVSIPRTREVCIFVRYSHVIGDAFALRFLMDAWSEASHGNGISQPVRKQRCPRIPRTILDEFKKPTTSSENDNIPPQWPIGARYEMVRLDIYRNWTENRIKGGPIRPIRIEFHASWLDQLKIKAETQGRVKPTRPPSSNDVMCAVLWKWLATDAMRPYLTPGQDLSRPQPLYPLFNLRSRVKELPGTADMLGNAAFCVHVPATRGDLKEWDLSQLVNAIQAVVLTPETVVRQWAYEFNESVGCEAEDPTYLSRCIRLEHIKKLVGDGFCITNWGLLDWCTLKLGEEIPTDVGTLAGGDGAFSFARVISMCPKNAGLVAFTRVPVAAADEWMEKFTQGGEDGIVKWLGL